MNSKVDTKTGSRFKGEFLNMVKQQEGRGGELRCRQVLHGETQGYTVSQLMQSWLSRVAELQGLGGKWSRSWSTEMVRSHWNWRTYWIRSLASVTKQVTTGAGDNKGSPGWKSRC